jgi:hypothetical protein
MVPVSLLVQQFLEFKDHPAVVPNTKEQWAVEQTPYRWSVLLILTLHLCKTEPRLGLRSSETINRASKELFMPVPKTKYSATSLVSPRNDNTSSDRADHARFCDIFSGKALNRSALETNGCHLNVQTCCYEMGDFGHSCVGERIFRCRI